MALFRIPFENIPQRFTISLGGTSYVLVNRWNQSEQGGGWFIDILDEDEKPLLMNLPLVSGTDLFQQHEHLGLPGRLIVFTDGDPTGIPSLQSLGEESNVWLVTDDEPV